MVVNEVVHSVADATGRTDAEVKAILGAAALATTLIALLKGFDKLSQVGPFHTRKRGHRRIAGFAI